MSDDLVKRDFLIFKRGRGWYRAESKGYTDFKFDAGRYTKQDAEKITHPNGLDGPRDGMFYKHESEVSDFPSTRIEELEAKLAKAVETLQWQADAIRKSISAHHVGPQRVLLNGVYHNGPVASWAYHTLTGLEAISRTVLAELTGETDE